MDPRPSGAFLLLMRQSPESPGRGEMIDLAGRRLHVVRAGPAAGPLVVFEHGAFGCAADWAEVQARLAARRVRSLAYDRAGLGYSDPGPEPRDGEAIAADLAALLARLGETGPVVLVGHSMGGLMVRLFALTHPDNLVGVVLVDAVTPDVTATAVGMRAVRAYGRAMRLVALGARGGLMRAVATVAGNLIGLTGEAAVEKRWIYGSAEHARWSAAEVAQWPQAAQQAGRAEFAPDLPVSVVTAGPVRGRAALKAMQSAAALASHRGYVEHVARANHASLLGHRFADAVVRGVTHVLSAGKAPVEA
jgi:pimeloyl-ACP methyl ester carboxylesterase